MKSVVLFKLGNSGYITISANRLATFPALGYSYLINGVQWDVADRPIEPLAKSTDYTGQLMELLALDNPDEQSKIKAQGSITNLDAVDKTKIVLPGDESDVKLVLVRLAKSGSKASRSGLDLTVRTRQSSGPEQLIDKGEGRSKRRRKTS